MPELTKLTETACKKAPPNAKLWDTEIKGFALFTGKTTKTFYFQKDVKGLTQRIKIGNYPLIDAFDARVAALELATEHATGVAAKKTGRSGRSFVAFARASLRRRPSRGFGRSHLRSLRRTRG